MKKYTCDRCRISLIDKDGSPIPHYSMKDPKCKKLRLNKNEQFVCVPCVEIKEKQKLASGE